MQGTLLPSQGPPKICPPGHYFLGLTGDAIGAGFKAVGVVVGAFMLTPGTAIVTPGVTGDTTGVVVGAVMTTTGFIGIDYLIAC